MKLIITRPKADAELLAPRLHALGHSTILCPLMEIKQRVAIALPNVKIGAVCASSANGLEADLDWPKILAFPFFAVGPQSATAGRKRGFRQVVVAEGGNLNSLAALVSAKMQTKSGALLYLSGADISGDLTTLLRPAGIAVERLVVYDAVALTPTDLSVTVAEADGVVLYSPRAARLWTIAAMGLDTSGLQHFCLSSNVAAQLPQSLSISVARTPDDHGMMELLDRRGEAE